MPERAAETALEDLTDRSILTSDLSTQTYFLPPLTAKFIRSRRPEAVTQTGDALAQRAYALALQYGGDDNYEGFRTLDAEWGFLSAALPLLLTSDNDRLQTVSYQLDQILNFTGRWDELLWLHEKAESRALAAGDKESAGERAFQAGWLYFLRNQPIEVLACAARATEHWQDSTPRNKALAIQIRASGHRLQEDYPTAIAAYREVLEIDRSISPESDDVATDLNELAATEHENEDYATAERDYRAALLIAKKNNHQEGMAYTIGNLAGLALDREQWTEAESLAREALAMTEKIGRHELIAYDCHILAKALLMQSRSRLKRDKGNKEEKSRSKHDLLDEALSMSRCAIEIFTRLRQQDNLHEAQETLAEIEKVTSGK